MADEKRPKRFWQRHPVFIGGTAGLIAILLTATAVVAWRVPNYQREAAELDARMTEQERAARDRILESEARRGELAVALFQRELRMRALKDRGVHLALSVEDSTLYFRHGAATMRQVPVRIGGDSVVTAPDGRSWRLVRALGERRLAAKEIEPEYTVPEWVYVSRGDPVPPEAERRVPGGLGRYVLRLDDGTVIHTRPSRGPFAEGVPPAGFEVPEREMRVIFEALRLDTPVYIY